MSIPSVLQALLESIRTAVYGEEVRESIADSLEYVYTEAESFNTQSAASAEAAAESAEAAAGSAGDAETAKETIEDSILDISLLKNATNSLAQSEYSYNSVNSDSNDSKLDVVRGYIIRATGEIKTSSSTSGTYGTRCVCNRTKFDGPINISLDADGYLMWVFIYYYDDTATPPGYVCMTDAGSGGWVPGKNYFIPKIESNKQLAFAISFSHEDQDEAMTDEDIAEIKKNLSACHPTNNDIDRELDIIDSALFLQRRLSSTSDDGLFNVESGWIRYDGHVYSSGSSSYLVTRAKLTGKFSTYLRQYLIKLPLKEYKFQVFQYLDPNGDNVANETTFNWKSDWVQGRVLTPTPPENQTTGYIWCQIQFEHVDPTLSMTQEDYDLISQNLRIYEPVSRKIALMDNDFAALTDHYYNSFNGGLRSDYTRERYYYYQPITNEYADSYKHNIVRGYVKSSGSQISTDDGTTTFQKRAVCKTVGVIKHNVRCYLDLDGYDMQVFVYDHYRSEDTGVSTLREAMEWTSNKNVLVIGNNSLEPDYITYVRVCFAHNDHNQLMTDAEIKDIRRAFHMYYPNDDFDETNRNCTNDAIFSVKRPAKNNSTECFSINTGYIDYTGALQDSGSSEYYFYRAVTAKITLEKKPCMISLPLSDYVIWAYVYYNDNRDGVADSTTLAWDSEGWQSNCIITPKPPENYNGSVYLYVQFRHLDESVEMTADDKTAISQALRIYYPVVQDDPQNFAKVIQLSRPRRVTGEGFKTPPLVLLHCSDIHGDDVNLQRIVNFKNAYNDYINDIIHTGDTVAYQSQDTMDFWDSVSGSEKILTVVGNHDTFVYGSSEEKPWTALSESDSCAAYITPYINNWGLPSGAHPANKCYYYKDYTDEKVRVIVLDGMHQTSDQLTWFQTVLSGALTLDYVVVCAAHPRAAYSGTPINCTFDLTHIGSFPTSHNPNVSPNQSFPVHMEDGYKQAVAEFQAAGGRFACWLHGHYHYDLCYTVSAVVNDVTYTQLAIGVSHSGMHKHHTYDDQDHTPNGQKYREEGSITQDDFNVIAIDTYDNFVKVAGFGATVDRYMQRRETMSYSFATNTLISN